MAVIHSTRGRQARSDKAMKQLAEALELETPTAPVPTSTGPWYLHTPVSGSPVITDGTTTIIISDIKGA